VTAIAADAVKAERERILDIENSTPPGYDEIVAKAKADGKSTAADVALAIVREQKAKGVKVIENLAADEKAVKGLRSEPANGEGEKPVAPAAATDEAGWKKEFTASEALQGEFRTVEAYVAFKKAKAEGRVRILTGKAAK
jgi:hypothetical protein